MLDNKKLQLAGPVGVIITVACADVGARALAYWPSSPVLWYLNLEVFRPVQYTFVAEKGMIFGDLGQIACVVLPLLALICIGLIANVRLLLAIASNMSLVYSVLLLFGLYFANNPVAEKGVKLSALVDNVIASGSRCLVGFVSFVGGFTSGLLASNISVAAWIF